MENQKKYYFVGASFGNEDQTKRFIKQEKWELGWLGEEDNSQYKKMMLKLNEMNAGDKIIIKSTYTQKYALPFDNPNGEYVSVMKLKAFGTITENLHDGHTVKVEWHQDFQPKEWYFSTGRETIWDVSEASLQVSRRLIDFVEKDVPQDFAWFLNQPEWSKLRNNTKLKISQNDVKVFREYLDNFIEVVNNSAGNIGTDKNGRKIKNFVVGGTTESAKLPSGLPLGKKYAGAGNRLYRYPYINNQNRTNLYYDWKPEHFDKPTLFVTVPNKEVNFFSNPLVKGFNVSTGKQPNFVSGYEASSPLEEIDYEKLLRAMMKLTSNNKKQEKAMIKTDEYQNQYSKQLLLAKNLILRGAPGTGKTYLANEIAADVVSDGRTSNINDLTEEEKKRVGFVQFHPSYDYTDFVEGLRPVTSEDGGITFELKPGTFKSFVESAINSKVSGGQDNFDEAWGKFFEAVTEASGEGKGYNQLKTLTGKPIRNVLAYERNDVQGIYPAKTTTYMNHDQIYNVYQGLPGTPKKGFDAYRRAIVQHLKDEYGLKDFIQATLTVNKSKYVFIIDEINRGEISRIFGELFFSIDPGYRGNKQGVDTQYANLHLKTEEKFYIPDNVYIIGTMNDIDRSVDTFDFAMRRRFTFIEVTADASADNMQLPQDVKKQMQHLNKSIVDKGELTSDYQIGASYFINLEAPETDKKSAPLWDNKIYPLLKDYFRGENKATDKLKAIKQDYFNEEG